MHQDFQQTTILAGLRDAHEERQRLQGDVRRVDEKITSIVGAARGYGISWQNIAHVLGVSKQAAWERFGDLDRQESR